MEPVRIALIGASGMMGRIRLEQLNNEPRAKLVAVCGRDVDKLKRAVGEHEIGLSTRPQDLYESDEVDAVAICIFNALHYEHAKQALQAGKHVLCEYPLADSLEQYDELAGLAQEQGVVLHHSMTVRAESLHRTMKKALADLGEPRCAYYRYYGGSSWYIDPDKRGDLFCALHIHFIDQFVDLLGQPEGLTAHGVEKDGKVSAVAMMQWPGGVTGTIEFCMGFTDKPGYMGTIVTTDGWCGFSTDPEMHVTATRGGETQTLAVPADTSKEEDMASFLDEVLKTGGPQCDLATGRNAIALCLECSRQFAAG